jgi:lysophospholipase L1-like esterase
MFGSKLEVRRFEDRILKYESVPVQTGKILFYGHSLFTRCSWITKRQENPKLEEEVRMKDGSQAIVNHGFGTSSADDLLYYYDRMVRPYKPRALVLATSGNDVGFGYSAHDIMDILARIIDWAQADFPGIPIFVMGRGPALARVGQVNVFTRIRKEYDELLRDYCANTEGVTYVNLGEQPFYYNNPEDIGDFDKVRDDIFAADGKHFNAKGYTYYMDFVREFLGDLLEEE